MGTVINKEYIMVDTTKFDTRHGGAFDRGSADSYYHRPRSPHYFVGGTHQSEKVVLAEGSAEYEAYMAGYDYNEQYGDKKDWG
jgi:hypothetical protein